MIKPLLITTLPLALIGCMEQATDRHIDFNDVRIDIELNQEFNSQQNHRSDGDSAPQNEETEEKIERQPESELEDEPEMEMDDEPEMEMDDEPEMEMDDEPEMEMDDEPEMEMDDEPEMEMDDEPEMEMDDINTDDSDTEQGIIRPILELEEEEEAEIEPNELHEVQLMIAADDHWEGWINGEYFGTAIGFTTVKTFTFEAESGEHLIAIKAEDLSLGVNGMIASVSIDGEPYSTTGDGQWLATKDQPTEDWMHPDFDSSLWNVAQPCAASSVEKWAGEPQSIIQKGAEWIWYNFDCKRNLGTSWFHLSIIIE